MIIEGGNACRRYRIRKNNRAGWAAHDPAGRLPSVVSKLHETNLVMPTKAGIGREAAPFSIVPDAQPASDFDMPERHCLGP